MPVAELPPHKPLTPTELTRPHAARRPAVWFAILLLGPLLLGIIAWLRASQTNTIAGTSGFLLIIAVLTASLGTLLGLMLIGSAQRTEDGRTFLVGMTFLTGATMLFIHGLTMPGSLIQGHALAHRWSLLLAIVIGGLCLLLSCFELSSKISQTLTRHAVVIVGMYGLGLFGYIAAVFGYLSVKLVLPAALSQNILFGFGLSCIVIALGRYYALYRSSPSLFGIALISALLLIGEAILVRWMVDDLMLGSWACWLLILAAVSILGYALITGYRHGQTDIRLLEGLFLTGTRTRLIIAYASAMDELIFGLARGEIPSPELHRILREQLNMTDAQLRVLENAANAVADERRQREEMERLNAELRRLEQNREQLTQMIVHDLRNPLTALVGFLDLMKLGPLDEEQQELLENALRSGRNLSNLIGNLLDTGKMQEGRMQLDCSLFEVDTLLLDLAASSKAWALVEDKVIHVDVPDNLPLLYADARLVRRILDNLIGNAIKYTTPQTQIWLRARQALQIEIERLPSKTGVTPPYEQFIIIEVADNGPGIPTEDLRLIFEKYGRSHTPDGIKREGTGLGLTFCRLATETHGGLMSVASSVGYGTVFTLALPLIEPHVRPAPHLHSAAPAVSH